MDAVHLARAGAQTSFDVSAFRRISGLPRSTLARSVRCSTTFFSMRGRRCLRAESLRFARKTSTLKTAAGIDSRVRISVRDYGCGIPADVLPRIFDPYFTTKPGGSGLGLATAYAIIAKHGGNLSVGIETRGRNGIHYRSARVGRESRTAGSPYRPHTNRDGTTIGHGRRRGSPEAAGNRFDHSRLRSADCPGRSRGNCSF